MPEEPEVETEKLHEAIQEELERDSSQASDQWAYYQAKGVKGAVQEAVRASWLAAGKEPPASAEEKVARYEKEQEAIREKAVELEEEREAKVAESEHLLRGRRSSWKRSGRPRWRSRSTCSAATTGSRTPSRSSRSPSRSAPWRR